jgi:hypothetical protein
LPLSIITFIKSAKFRTKILIIEIVVTLGIKILLTLIAERLLPIHPYTIETLIRTRPHFKSGVIELGLKTLRTPACKTTTTIGLLPRLLVSRLLVGTKISLSPAKTLPWRLLKMRRGIGTSQLLLTPLFPWRPTLWETLPMASHGQRSDVAARGRRRR